MSGLFNRRKRPSNTEETITIGGSGRNKPSLLNSLRPIQDIQPPKPNTVPETEKPVETLSEKPAPVTDEVVITTENEQSQILGDSTLPFVQNPYPVEIGTDPSPNYSKDGDSIKYTGKYKQNFITFSTQKFDDIKSLDINEYPTSFNFIVEFIDGDNREYWSSPVLLGQLQAEMNSNNPYKTRTEVPVLQFDFKFIKGYGSQEQFKIPEDYAEVEVTKTITTKQDVLKHLDWLISSDETLRRAREIGDWTVNITEDLGMSFSRPLDELNSKILNEESNISDNIDQTETDGDSSGEVSAGNTQSGGGSDDNDNEIPNGNNALLYPPFGVKGRRKNEIRTKGGTRYRWSRVRNVWIQLR